MNSMVRSVLFAFLSFETVFAQTVFEHVTDHPVFSYGATGEWDGGTVWNPTIIKDGDTLRMWYTGYPGSVWEPTHGKIGYAWSLDGIAWNRFAGNPVLSGDVSWESGDLFSCAVLKDSNMYKMWYSGGSITTIGYATSPDGISWTKHPDPVLQRDPSPNWGYSILAPHAVLKQDGVYRMWYWAGKSGFPFKTSLPQTGLATSTDGIHWVKYNDTSTTEPAFADNDPVLRVGESGQWDEMRAIDPMVLPTDSGYEMWYVGLKAPINADTRAWIGYATSTDGVNWKKWPANPIINQDPVWGYCYYGGTVLKFGDRYHLWYSCFHTSPTQARPQIGYTAEPPDGVGQSVHEGGIPSEFLLNQNYPNPFNPKTVVSFQLPVASRVKLVVYDLLGREVKVLMEEKKEVGKHEVMWDAGGCASGVYICRMTAGDFVDSKKLLLVR